MTLCLFVIPTRISLASCAGDRFEECPQPLPFPSNYPPQFFFAILTLISRQLRWTGLKDASVQQPPFPSNDPLLVLSSRPAFPPSCAGHASAPAPPPVGAPLLVLTPSEAERDRMRHRAPLALTCPHPPPTIPHLVLMEHSPTYPLSFQVSRSGPQYRTSSGSLGMRKPRGRVSVRIQW